MPKFFAYRHVNGNIKVKRYSPESHDDAFDSDFVDDVTDAYDAENRLQAEEIAKQRLSLIRAAELPLERIPDIPSAMNLRKMDDGSMGAFDWVGDE